MALIRNSQRMLRSYRATSRRTGMHWSAFASCLTGLWSTEASVPQTCAMDSAPFLMKGTGPSISRISNPQFLDLASPLERSNSKNRRYIPRRRERVAIRRLAPKPKVSRVRPQSLPRRSVLSASQPKNWRIKTSSALMSNLLRFKQVPARQAST